MCCWKLVAFQVIVHLSLSMASVFAQEKANEETDKSADKPLFPLVIGTEWTYKSTSTDKDGTVKDVGVNSTPISTMKIRDFDLWSKR